MYAGNKNLLLCKHEFNVSMFSITMFYCISDFLNSQVFPKKIQNPPKACINQSLTPPPSAS